MILCAIWLVLSWRVTFESGVQWQMIGFEYVAQLVVIVSLNVVGFVFKNITRTLDVCITGYDLPQTSLKLSLLVVLIVGAQLIVTLSISQAVIFLLLMTSGDVERNPGPEQTLTSRFHTS